jgi:hypothetical protein
MSTACPTARSALPIRPGVEFSWCRTISTGRSDGAASALAFGWNGIGSRLLISKW